MANIPNNQEWRDFFECYKALPELWQIKSDLYKDKIKRRIAWAKLLKVYNRIEVGATLDKLKKRITNIRTCFRREMKKIECSQRSGAGADGKHVPNLWYFDCLDFLCDQEVQLQWISMVEDEEYENAEGAMETVSTVNSEVKSHGSWDMGQLMSERNELLKIAFEQLTKPNDSRDDASIYADSWAASYRKLSKMQQIYAKKAIEDILVLGQLELLSLNYLNNHPSTPTTQSPYSTDSLPSVSLQHQQHPSSTFSPTL